MSERRSNRIILYSGPLHCFVVSDDGAYQVMDIITRLQGALCEVPDELQQKTFIKIESAGDHEDEYPVEIELYYMQPETDAEQETRIALESKQAAETQAAVERAERVAYEAMKEKYGWT